MAITRYNPVHALLYLAVSFLSVAMIFLSLGAPFVAALEVIVYAGAIIVLFIFVVMMLNLGRDTAIQEREWLRPKVWVVPSILVLVLLTEWVILLVQGARSTLPVSVVSPKRVALSLYGEYLIAVELVGFLLMAGIVGAAHIGKHTRKELHRFLQNGEEQEKEKAIQQPTEQTPGEKTVLHD